MRREADTRRTTHAMDRARARAKSKWWYLVELALSH